MSTAWSRIMNSHRPSTNRAHRLYFQTFLAFVIFMGFPVLLSLHNVLAFLEYLYQKALSPKVIKNYVSSLSTMAKNFGLDHQDLFHQAIFRYLRSIQLNSPFRPTPRGFFDIPTLYHISLACDQLPDPQLYRAIFDCSLWLSAYVKLGPSCSSPL